jgi:regulator of nucleoside diphosphate kinase
VEEADAAREQGSIEGRKNMKRETLIISDVDRENLEALIESSRIDSLVREDSLNALEVELRRARIVPADKVPANVITMNSIVRLRDLDSGETEEYELVYPADADMALHRISVLAPVGTAILGYRRGDIIEWPVPAGLRRLRVEAVISQPERVG